MRLTHFYAAAADHLPIRGVHLNHFYAAGVADAAACWRELGKIPLYNQNWPLLQPCYPMLQIEGHKLDHFSTEYMNKHLVSKYI